MAITISQLLVGATLLQSLAFAAFLLTERFRGALANRFLVAALLVMAAVKADELYQLANGLRAYPEWGFILAPVQPLLAPALYFFIRARINQNFVLRWGHAWHLVPFAAYALYLWSAYFRFDVELKRQLVETDALSAPLSAFVVPAASDVIQLGYIAAALVLISRHGLALREWFSRLDDRSLAWLRPIFMLWVTAFLVHLGRTVAVGGFGARGADLFIIPALDAGHFFLINLLALSAITAFSAQPLSGLPEKYAASPQSAAERRALFVRAEAIVAAKALFLAPDLTLQDFADALGATPRELSEAINGESGDNFYAFINRRRIEHAKVLLLEDRRTRVLEVALASGFNSKSTFNETFQRYAGVSPSVWRRRGAERAPVTAEGAAVSA